MFNETVKIELKIEKINKLTLSIFPFLFIPLFILFNELTFYIYTRKALIKTSAEINIYYEENILTTSSLEICCFWCSTCRVIIIINDLNKYIYIDFIFTITNKFFYAKFRFHFSFI